MLSLRRLSMVALAALLTTSVLGATAASAADEPENVVKYRKNQMRAQGAHLGMIFAVVKGEVSWTEVVVDHAQALNDMSQVLPRLFPAGSGKADGLDSRALVVIWEKPDDFAARLEAFQNDTAALVEAAKGGDMAAIGAAAGKVGQDSCTACHETFRAES
jgi:cytochrome c556